MEPQCQVDVDVNPSKGNVYPMKFKRRSVSAVRVYPKHCGVPNSTLGLRKGQDEISNEDSCRGVSRMHPSSKIRNGVHVLRDFPLKLNEPNATNIHDTHACMKSKEDGIEESKSLMEFKDERCLNTNFRVHDIQDDFDVDEGCLTVHDSQGVFNDNEKSLKTSLVALSNSQDGLSKDDVIPNNGLRNDSERVRKIINLFRVVYMELLRDNKGKSKGRFSFDAASILLKQHNWIKRDKHVGPISGVEVGDYFDWRVEMSIIGLHCQNIRGIDYMKLNGKHLAISVVDSGRYDNVFKSNYGDFSDFLIYSGEGENPKVQRMKSIDDQKLIGGNLALKNSMKVKNPIRVIRKVLFKCGKIENHKYVYDGLYFVDSYRQERAPSGKLAFKFLLKKFPKQPQVNWKEVIRKLVCMNDASRGGERELICGKPAIINCVTDDMTQAKERIPIRELNDLDDERPPIFNFATNVTYPESSHPSMIDDGCDCSDGCSDSEDCPCIVKSGGSTYNYEELLIKAKPLIVECGPSCKCFTSCLNRVCQRGIRLPLEVFKTEAKGWGVRSRSLIPRGSFICEYTPEILQDIKGEQRISKVEYLSGIGVGGNKPFSQDSISLFSFKGKGCFTIDAARLGNVGRFINHSCSPNLFAQNVLFDRGNKRMPHVMLFAKKVIPPFEELTYHYN